MTLPQFHYTPLPDLDQTLVQRLHAFPRRPDIFQYLVRSLVNLIIRLYLRLYHRLKITGQENLPQEGSFVLVCNHASHLDALCLLAALPLRKLHRAFPAAAADYFFESLPRTAIAVLTVNALPFHRQVHVRQSITLCRELLANPGNILIIFPEGTRSQTGELHDFKPGIGLMLAGSTIPAVPCYLKGSARAWPKGSCIPRPRRITLTIGTPHNFAETSDEKESIHAICNDLHDAVELLGKEQ